MTIQYDGRVAIVTGAGAGLGREYALALAARGAAVVVNDPGVTMSGTDPASSVAAQVAAEITAAGGKAISHTADVSDYTQVEQMVADTLAAFGRVDILVNNAGILRDGPFAEMDMADFARVLTVHLQGSANTSKAVWQQMSQQGFGRIVMTTSSSGLFGSPGQASYAAAKAGTIGLMSTLGLEGESAGIRVNAISPVANTRMSQGHFPGTMGKYALTEYVTAALLFLCSDEAPNRCTLFSALGGLSVAHMTDTDGLFLGERCSPEAIREQFAAIADTHNLNRYNSVFEHMTRFNAAAGAVE